MSEHNSDQGSAAAADSSPNSDTGSFWSNEPNFPYSPLEYRRIFTEFYQYLIDLYIPAESLQLPPEDGWPDFPDDIWRNFRAPETLDVLRHLPILVGRVQGAWDSVFFDYRGLDSAIHRRPVGGTCAFDAPESYHKAFYEELLDDRGSDYLLCICEGHGTGALDITLDVKYGQIIGYHMGFFHDDLMDITEYIQIWKNRFERLHIVPGPPLYPFLDGEDVEEIDPPRIITEDEVLDQKVDFPSDLDIQYIRQIYRAYGWPNNFQREAGFQEIQDLIDKLDDRAEDTDDEPEYTRCWFILPGGD